MNANARTTASTWLDCGHSLSDSIDFGRVALFARAWLDNQALTESNRLMVEDLIWHASLLEKAKDADVPDGLVVREITCHLCRLQSAPRLPPCRSEGCALHGPS